MRSVTTSTNTKLARSILLEAPGPGGLVRAISTQERNAPLGGPNPASELTLTGSISEMSSRTTFVCASSPLNSSPNPFHERHYGIGRLWSRQARSAVHRSGAASSVRYCSKPAPPNPPFS